MTERKLESTLRALSACGEALTAISEMEPNAGWDQESPFNQRCLAGLSLAIWKLADYAYCELADPNRCVTFSINADLIEKLDGFAEQWNCDRDEAASRLVLESLRRFGMQKQ